MPKTGLDRAKTGRAKGTPNKTTAMLRDAILNAFTEVGGQSYLARIADQDPRTFCTLLGKVLPLQVSGEGGKPMQITVVTGVPRADD